MKLVYYLVLKPLSFLPLWLLYVLGAIIFFFLYRVFGYRKTVVFKNLKNSFPNRSEKEIKSIGTKFYWHMTNLIVESIKIFSISKSQAKSRMVVNNAEEIDRHYDNGKSVLMIGGHYANWEIFAVAVDDQIKHETYAVYFPLKNEFMDKKMRASRGKYGLKMISSKMVKDVLKKAEDTSKPIALILATDQSPSNPKNAYWLEFLNQDTGVLFGAEKYAKDYDMPIVYGGMDRVKKGYYSISYDTLVEEPKSHSYGEITKIHTKRLEKDILKRPELWLWSHKRWKKTRPENANQPR